MDAAEKVYLRPGKHFVWKIERKVAKLLMLTIVYLSICYFFMMHTQLVIVRVKGQPRLLFCILLSVLKVTFTNNRRDGLVKLGWQQRVY
jgi:hypothetical protein